MNKVIAKGRLTKNIERQTTVNNKTVVQFTLAINEGYGENQKTNFIKCEAWNALAENLSKYCEKGSLLLIEGRIKTESYNDQNGQKKSTFKVIVQNIEFLDNKKNKPYIEEKEASFQEFTNEIELTDDLLPF